MKRKRSALLILMTVPFLLAMGMMGGPSVRNKAPEPKEKLDATLVDMDGISTKVTYISYDGQLYLPFYLGQALITIPFQEINKIEFGKKVQSRRMAKVFFKNEEEQELLIDEKVFFIGTLPYGTYQIQVKDLERIEFTASHPE